ncbi:MAG TPA: response regulator [Nitrospiria bacterium]|nr:response regulator [Nitrospiria bacterium]
MNHEHNSRRILVIEDDDALRSVLMEELTAAGYHVIPAVDGAEGAQKVLQSSGSSSFDLIITDIKMPRMSGKGLLAVAKEHCPSVPVIAITSYGNDLEFLKPSQTGFFSYLRKPFKMEELNTAVQAGLRQGGG